MSKGNKQYSMIANSAVDFAHDAKKHGPFKAVAASVLDAVWFKQTHGSRWKTVAHRMRTWYAAKFKQAVKDKDAIAAYRMMDQHNHMLSMIQQG